jgi:hypothetical protein
VDYTGSAMSRQKIGLVSHRKKLIFEIQVHIPITIHLCIVAAHNVNSICFDEFIRVCFLRGITLLSEVHWVPWMIILAFSPYKIVKYMFKVPVSFTRVSMRVRNLVYQAIATIIFYYFLN